jgi:GGDEF domain-containing protein
VAVAPKEKPATYEQLKELAAAALAEAKRAGRNRSAVKVIE